MKIIKSIFPATVIALFVLTACAISQDDDISEPTSSGKPLQRGQVTIDETTILVMESFPMQVELLVKGQLPTPCHELRWEVEEPDVNNRIHVTLFTVVDPEVVCIQVMDFFETRIRLGDFTETGYSVWLNGEEIGDF